MPIDSFAVAYSAASRTTEIPGQDLFALVDGRPVFLDLLTGLGWTAHPKQAKAAIRWYVAPVSRPRVPPVPENEKATVYSSQRKNVTVGGEGWAFYDPEAEKAGDGNCVAMGTTVAASVMAMSGALGGTASIVGDEWVTVLTGWPNGTAVRVPPFDWMVSGAATNFARGGYRFTSPAGFTVEIYREGGWNWTQFFPGDASTKQASGHWVFRVSSGTSGDVYQTLSGTTQPVYTAVASAQQLAMWGPGPTGNPARDWSDHDTAFLVSRPWTPADGSGADCVVVLGLTAAFSWSNAYEWPRRLHWGRASVSVAGGPWTSTATLPPDAKHPGLILPGWAAGQALRTPGGRVLAGNAYVSVAVAGAVEARIVGKLWDAFVASDAPAGSAMRLDGRTWLKAMGQGGSSADTRGSLWIAAEE